MMTPRKGENQRVYSSAGSAIDFTLHLQNFWFCVNLAKLIRGKCSMVHNMGDRLLLMCI